MHTHPQHRPLILLHLEITVGSNSQCFQLFKNVTLKCQFSKISDFPVFQTVTDIPSFPKRSQTVQLFRTSFQNDTNFPAFHTVVDFPPSHTVSCFPIFHTVQLSAMSHISQLSKLCPVSQLCQKAPDSPSQLRWRCTVTLTSAPRCGSIQGAKQTFLLLPSPQLILQLIIRVQLSRLLQLGHLGLLPTLAPCLQLGSQGLLRFGLLFFHVVLLTQAWRSNCQVSFKGWWRRVTIMMMMTVTTNNRGDGREHEKKMKRTVVKWDMEMTLSIKPPIRFTQKYQLGMISAKNECAHRNNFIT